jgi:hypothetical protein
VVKPEANAKDADFAPSLRVVEVEGVTLVLAVQSDSQVLMDSVMPAVAKTIVLVLLVQVAFPNDVGDNDPMTRIVSPGAVLAAVAPVSTVFHRVAKLVPALASFPPSKSK